MIEQYLAMKSFTQCIELFVINFPNSVPPNKSSVSQVVSKFHSTGSVGNQLKEHSCTMLTTEKLAEIKDVFETKTHTIFLMNYTLFVAFFCALFAFFVFGLHFKWHALYKQPYNHSTYHSSKFIFGGCSPSYQLLYCKFNNYIHPKGVWWEDQSVGRLCWHPFDEIWATGLGSLIISSEADSMCFLHLVMGDIRFAHSWYGLRTPVKNYKVWKSTQLPFWHVFRDVHFHGFFMDADLSDPLPTRDDFDQYGSNYFRVLVDRRRRIQRSWSEGQIFLDRVFNILGPASPDTKTTNFEVVAGRHSLL